MHHRSTLILVFLSYLMLAVCGTGPLFGQFRSGPYFYDVMEYRQSWYAGAQVKFANAKRLSPGEINEPGLLRLLIKRRITQHVLIGGGLGLSTHAEKDLHYGIQLEGLIISPERYSLSVVGASYFSSGIDGRPSLVDGSSNDTSIGLATEYSPVQQRLIIKLWSVMRYVHRVNSLQDSNAHQNGFDLSAGLAASLPGLGISLGFNSSWFTSNEISNLPLTTGEKANIALSVYTTF